MSPDIEAIMEALEKCWAGCIQGDRARDFCFYLGSKGSHAVLSTCDEYTVNEASWWNLVPGEKIIMEHRVLGFYDTNPLR